MDYKKLIFQDLTLIFFQDLTLIFFLKVEEVKYLLRRSGL